MSDKYKVILTGELVQSVDETTALEQFAERFNMTLDKAKAMFSKAPVAIKKDMEQERAAKLEKAINSLGLGAQIEPMMTDASQEIIAQETAEAEANQELAPVEPSSETQLATTDTDDGLNGSPDSMPGYQFSYTGRPDYGFVTVQIPANETLKVEASSMATMDTNVKMKTKMRGGLGRLVSGESMFINEFTAENGPAEIGIAPGTPGDITHEYLDGQTIFLQNSAFVACTQDVEVETKWQGFTKGFFSGESFFLIRCSGRGDLWFNTYGSMIEIDVDGEYVVDTGNIVAFSEGLDYEITKVGGYKSLFFSGEGFVCRFHGKGKLWLQTRGTDAFVSWCQPFRRVEKSSN